MSEPASITQGIAQRYATAVFELAVESSELPLLEKDVATLGDALASSNELGELIASPIYSREEQVAAISAVAAKAGLGATLTNSLSLMAQKRRLFVLPQLLTALREKISEAKGEVTAEVTAAKALTKTQSDKLAKSLKATVGKDVNLDVTVDESLIGGLVVKVGSQMIDTSVKARLNALQNSMKEVG